MYTIFCKDNLTEYYLFLITCFIQYIPTSRFLNCRIFDSVDFIFAAKEGKTLNELVALQSLYLAQDSLMA